MSVIAERSLIFSAASIRAILAGTKTQTRRVGDRYAKWRRGDRVWVRETWAQGMPLNDGTCSHQTAYRADGRWGTCGRYVSEYEFNPFGWINGVADRDNRGDWVGLGMFGGRWRPSIHMPRWASRIDLEVVDVWREQLQEISRADIRAEGEGGMLTEAADRQLFQRLWDGLNSRRGYPWESNPRVTVIVFRRVRP